jgi:flagellar basal-body rod protein FlgF
MVFKGFYTAASGMLALQRRQEMLTNNVSNINTPGYKADQASMRSFPSMLLSEISGAGFFQDKLPVKNEIGSISTGVYAQDITPLFVQGDLQQTDLYTDLAISHPQTLINGETGNPSSILFMVENQNGEQRYTRNGSFSVDDRGQLVTSTGGFVLDVNGERINVGANAFEVDDEGYITINGQQQARLGIAFIEEANMLVKEGNGLFRLEGNNPVGQAYDNPEVNFQVKQGFVERSNVNIEETMVNMMNTFRAFEANQKVLQAYDRSMEKAVNEIGRIG